MNHDLRSAALAAVLMLGVILPDMQSTQAPAPPEGSEPSVCSSALPNPAGCTYY